MTVVASRTSLKLAILLRASGVGLGFLAALMFFALGSSALSPAGFAALVVAMNCCILVQAFDSGVGARFVTALARHRSKSTGPFEVAEYVASSTGIATLVSACVCFLFILTLATSNSLEYLTVGLIAITGGWFATSASSLMGTLVASERMTGYYLASLAQPVSLVGATAALWMSEAQQATAFAGAFAVATVAPTIVAGTLVAKARAITLLGPLSTKRIVTLLRTAAPLGASQIAGTIVYLGLPTLVGLSGSTATVTAYAFALRMYVALWSVVGILNLAYWPQLASTDVADRNSSRTLRSHVNKLGGALGVGAVGVYVVLLFALPLTGQSDLLPSVGVTLVVAAGFFVRSCFVGEVLGVTVTGPSRWLVGTQWTIAAATAAVVVTAADEHLLVAGLALLVASAADGLAMRRWNRPRRVERNR